MRTFCERPGFYVRCLLLVPLLLLAAGCGAGKSGSVSGKVYYKGEVLKSGTVAFYPEGGGGNFTSPIGADGSYTITKVRPGKMKISVASAAAGVQLGPQMGRGQAAAKKGMEQRKDKLKENAPPGAPVGTTASEPGVKLPEKYTDPERSGLSVEVTGGKQEHDIKLD
jgi:hypothetical protein